ncbi:MAG TPA: hypothetical protein VGC64_02490 [Pyrinomonadaceae bacterium]
MLLGIVIGVQAQGSSAAATAAAAAPVDTVVLKFSWSKERLPGWENNPFGPSFETYDDMRARVSDERRLQDARNSGKKAEASRIERDAQAREDATKKKVVTKEERARDGYRYKVTIKNTGAKTIKSIDWDYVFFDPATHQESARHQFTSDEKIAPGREKDLSVMILSPPVSTVSAGVLGSKGRLALDEQVMIINIRYADGSVWSRP